LEGAEGACGRGRNDIRISPCELGSYHCWSGSSYGGTEKGISVLAVLKVSKLNLLLDDTRKEVEESKRPMSPLKRGISNQWKQ
jgi:hypothetical protein